jgi:hypothetical protein
MLLFHSQKNKFYYEYQGLNSTREAKTMIEELKFNEINLIKSHNFNLKLNGLQTNSNTLKLLLAI